MNGEKTKIELMDGAFWIKTKKEDRSSFVIHSNPFTSYSITGLLAIRNLLDEVIEESENPK